MTIGSHQLHRLSEPLSMKSSSYSCSYIKMYMVHSLISVAVVYTWNSTIRLLTNEGES